MQELWQYILPGILGFLFCAFAHVCALHVFPKLQLLDFPERYGHKRSPIPYPTGILAIGIFLLLFFMYQDVTKQELGILLGIGVLGICSFMDDRFQVSAKKRLLIQMLVAMIIFGMGTRIYTITNPFSASGLLDLDNWVIPFALFSDPPVLSGMFTIGWLLLTMNALNWFDGIPGQVSLLSVIGFLTIGFLAISPRINHIDPAAQAQLATIAFVLAGISASCLLFDFPPNRVLMGDTGAMFFGLMLGVLTIYAGGKVATAFLVLGVPLIDSGIVIARRILKKKSPLRGNAVDEHLHHRLLHKGWSQRSIILLTAALGTTFGITALFLTSLQKVIAAILMACIMLCLSISARNE